MHYCFAIVFKTLEIHVSGDTRISCSQNLRMCQPIAISCCSTSRSRSTFLSIFLAQNSAFCTGALKCSGHLCQKHPSMNMANFFPGKTMSGRPGSWFLSRYRRPTAQSALRSFSSGLVFLPRIRDIHRLR